MVIDLLYTVLNREIRRRARVEPRGTGPAEPTPAPRPEGPTPNVPYLSARRESPPATARTYGSIGGALLKSPYFPAVHRVTTRSPCG